MDVLWNIIDSPLTGLFISASIFIAYMLINYTSKERSNPELNYGILILLSGTGIQAGLKLIKFSCVDITSNVALADFKPMIVHFAIGGVAVIWASITTINTCFDVNKKTTPVPTNSTP